VSSGATDGAVRARTQAARSLICAVGAGGEGDGAFDEGADVRLQRVDVLGQHRLLDPRDEALVGEVDPVDLDLRRFPVEQVVAFAFGVLPDGLVGVEEPAAAEDAAEPAVHAHARDGERALVEGLRVVVQLGEVDVVDGAAALAAGAHAAGDGERAALLDRAAALLHGDGAGAADRGDVERERLR
jgi:hypothetical protein